MIAEIYTKQFCTKYRFTGSIAPSITTGCAPTQLSLPIAKKGGARRPEDCLHSVLKADFRSPAAAKPQTAYHKFLPATQTHAWPDILSNRAWYSPTINSRGLTALLWNVCDFADRKSIQLKKTREIQHYTRNSKPIIPGFSVPFRAKSDRNLKQFDWCL